MYVKMKCYRLKQDVPVEDLEDYGFEKNSVGNYIRTTNEKYDYVIYYIDSKRFVVRGVGWREGRARIVAKHIKDLILDNLAEKVKFYEWWTIIGRWQDYPQKKIDKIEAKLEKLNEETLTLPKEE